MCASFVIFIFSMGWLKRNASELNKFEKKKLKQTLLIVFQSLKYCTSKSEAVWTNSLWVRALESVQTKINSVRKQIILNSYFPSKCKTSFPSNYSVILSSFPHMKDHTWPSTLTKKGIKVDENFWLEGTP